jgi:hypothetical protein
MVRYVEKSGESIEEAIVILGAKNNLEGVFAEYQYLETKLGKYGKKWKLELQALIQKGDKYYDEMNLKLHDGTKKTFYFDVNSFAEKR